MFHSVSLYRPAVVRWMLRFAAILFLCLLQRLPASAQVPLTTLHAFGGVDGVAPNGSLVQGGDGAFYGITVGGGGNGMGTFFKLASDGTLTTLYSFGASSMGLNGDLIQGADGAFYGTTSGGGANGSGAIFKITSDGTLTTLYSFSASPMGTRGSTGVNADGIFPPAGLTQGSDHAFYGTTEAGGANNRGTIFKITPDGTLTTLYHFSDIVGAVPLAGLVQGSDGLLYGATSSGGDTGNGTLFRISTNGMAFNLLHTFGDNPNNPHEGLNPAAALIQGSDGAFYGTTVNGGANNKGTVFKFDPSQMPGSGREMTTLYNFSMLNSGANGDGAYPTAALVQGLDGALYGVTSAGGLDGGGTVFKITTDGMLTTLHSFTKLNDGAFPAGKLIVGGDGNLYGTATEGGANNDGTIFTLNITSPTAASQMATASGPTPITLSAVSPIGKPLVYTIVAPPSHGFLSGAAPNLTYTAALDYSGLDSFTFQAADSDGRTSNIAIVSLTDLVPITVTNLTLTPSVVRGGLQATGVIVLSSAPVLPTGVMVTLSSSNSAAADPSQPTVLVPQGSNTAVFTLLTFPVASRQNVKIAAAADGGFITRTLTVRPSGVASVSLNPTVVIGGTANSNGVVTLDTPAPSGGFTVTLASNRPAAAAPASSTITIPAGSTTGAFTVASSLVNTTQNVTITASGNGTTASAVLSVKVVAIQSFTLSTNNIQGGGGLTGTITLNAPALKDTTVPTATVSQLVTLNGGNPVVVPAGATSVTFPITTQPVTARDTATLKATLGGVTKSVGLTLLP